MPRQDSFDPAPLLDPIAAFAGNLFSASDRCMLPDLPLSAQGAVALALARSSARTVIWITESPHVLESSYTDLLAIAGREKDSVLYFPPRENIIRTEEDLPDPETAGHRASVLLALEQPGSKPATPLPLVIATCIQAIMQPVMKPSEIREKTLVLNPGTTIEMSRVAKTAAGSGYNFANEVTEKGLISTRGGIIDIWPVTEDWPLRIEFVGDTIESIRSFDPVTQRSREKTAECIVPPAPDIHPDSSNTDRLPCLTSYLPDGSLAAWSDVEAAKEHAHAFHEIIEETGNRISHISFESLKKRLKKRTAGQLFFNSGENTTPFPEFLEPDSVFKLPEDIMQPDIMEQTRNRILEALHDRAERGQSVFIFFESAGSMEHMSKQLKPNGIHGVVAPLSSGFTCPELKLTVAAESNIYGHTKKSLRRTAGTARGNELPENAALARVAGLADLEPGCLVVHMEHGVGRYMGLNEIIFNGRRQEVITVEYDGSAKLHVPVSQAHLLSRYVGIAGMKVRLHKLGGRRWNKERLKAERSIMDLAASLLETQAQRDLLEGFSFPETVPWQQEFAAAFPYKETTDQVTVFKDVEKDMISTHPMDRLVCGDAGYGKTEIAMRAAFKAVMSGKQVAVLVPTTVLAQQHMDTFSERMELYPVRIEMLSRFCSSSARERTLKSMADGSVDIVIGTHALVQPSVKFKDLGLVIVDEEQRFGVAHKEHLKTLRRLVDVLTLTATPIPRTLYMSLTGARDMSLLQTPPGERMAIETIVAKSTDVVIRNAVLREINRDGQVFYVHNRIITIGQVRARLENMLPGIKIETAHGRMASGELAAVMKRFTEQKFDLLLCTTIIESGLDIPTANTILIDRADRFGIADLYQLRGRVGRSRHKAYAYLLLPEQTRIDTDARKRIHAVKKYSALSAGFNLAMQDLEIRGAGNLLGAEQSGHISAIGFGLYCQLLKRSVAQLQGTALPAIIDVNVLLDFVNLSPADGQTGAAVIPYSYIDDDGFRISAYRKIAESSLLSEVAGVRSELTDRFGPTPAEVDRLLKIAEIRIMASEKNITRIENRDEKIMISRGQDYITGRGGRFPRFASSDPDERLKQIEELVKKA